MAGALTGAAAADPVSETTLTVAAADIAPIAPAIRVGDTRDVAITVTPSPLPAGTSLTVEIVADGGTSARAVFADTGATTRTLTGTETVRVRGTAAGPPDTLRLVVRITGQAEVLAERRFTVENRINLFVAFEIWNLATRAFERLPAGVPVELVDFDPTVLDEDDVLATVSTDTQGKVHFSLPDFSASGEDRPDLYFRVRGGGRAASGHALPDAWSTGGWRAVDGTPGLLDDFGGDTLGSDAAPVVFRVGLDFHVRVVYADQSLATPQDRGAPIGIPVSVFRDALINTRLARVRTDAAGEVHGVTFEAAGGDSLFLRVEFEMEDAAIHLNRARADVSDWDTDQGTPAQPSLGTQALPVELRAASEGRDVGLYMLKVLREHATFFFHMTDGGWPGFSGTLTMFRTAAAGTAYSWPVGSVNFPPHDHWDRSTMIHEVTHQVFWQELGISSAGIVVEAIFGGLLLVHDLPYESNGEHALIEGYPETLEAVFTRFGQPAYNFGSVTDPGGGNPRPLGPPPPNRGERVEGAFANGLYTVFWKHVLGLVTPPSAPMVPESTNGDITATTPFLANAAVRARFQSMLWEPLRDLRALSDPTTRDFIDRIEARNPAQWPAIRADLQAFNMAFP
jgi:hypothetical protein